MPAGVYYPPQQEAGNGSKAEAVPNHLRAVKVFKEIIKQTGVKTLDELTTDRLHALVDRCS